MERFINTEALSLQQRKSAYANPTTKLIIIFDTQQIISIFCISANQILHKPTNSLPLYRKNMTIYKGTNSSKTYTRTFSFFCLVRRIIGFTFAPWSQNKRL